MILLEVNCKHKTKTQDCMQVRINVTCKGLQKLTGKWSHTLLTDTYKLIKGGYISCKGATTVSIWRQGEVIKSSKGK